MVVNLLSPPNVADIWIVVQHDTLLGDAGSSGALAVETGLEIIEISRGCEAGMSSVGKVSKLSIALPLPPVGVTFGRPHNQERRHSYIDF